MSEGDSDEEHKTPPPTKLSVISAILKLIHYEVGDQYVIIGYPTPVDRKDEMKNLISLIPWVTYRRKFKELQSDVNGAKSHQYTSDSGWGCMIRVAQMMIVNTLIKHNHQSIISRVVEESKDENPIVPILSNQEHLGNIIPLVLDDYEGEKAPFGIRNVIEEGAKLLDKGAGEWYGAHSISQVIRKLNSMYNLQYNERFKILTFNEGVVYKDELDFHSCAEVSYLAIVPLRLGLNKVDKSYIPQLKAILSHVLSVGILGGKSNSAMYYVGFK